jgi:hypothetical protein
MAVQMSEPTPQNLTSPLARDDRRRPKDERRQTAVFSPVEPR